MKSNNRLIGKFPEFTFPCVLSGADPDMENKDKSQIRYITMKFKKPADQRFVRKQIKEFFLTQYNIQITSQRSQDIFKLGVEHMYTIRELAQQELDSMNSEDGVLTAVAKAQQVADRLIEATEGTDYEGIV